MYSITIYPTNRYSIYYYDKNTNFYYYVKGINYQNKPEGTYVKCLARKFSLNRARLTAKLIKINNPNITSCQVKYDP